MQPAEAAKPDLKNKQNQVRYGSALCTQTEWQAFDSPLDFPSNSRTGSITRIFYIYIYIIQVDRSLVALPNGLEIGMELLRGDAGSLKIVI